MSLFEAFKSTPMLGATWVVQLFVKKKKKELDRQAAWLVKGYARTSKQTQTDC